MLFINTRPISRAKRLTEFLQSQGVTVLDLPLLELVACELSQQHRQYLIQINTYQAVLFISETAVSYFFDFVQTHQIKLNPNVTIITVGQKTAETVKHFWRQISDISPKLITPSDFNLSENNEGLLQLPIIHQLKTGESILILKGKDGRDVLKNNLVKNTIKVNEIDFYQRIFPPYSEQIFQKFCQSDIFLSKKITLITSLTAWQHWQQLCKKFEVDIQAFSYVVLQSRIFNHICQSLPKQNLVQVENLHPETILLALQHFDKTA